MAVLKVGKRNRKETVTTFDHEVLGFGPEPDREAFKCIRFT